MQHGLTALRHYGVLNIAAVTGYSVAIELSRQLKVEWHIEAYRCANRNVTCPNNAY